MKYFSTRDASVRVSAAEAIATGLAPDGGLFVPESIPHIGAQDIEELRLLDYRGRAARIMGMYLDDFTGDELELFCRRAYSDNFDTPETAPLRIIDGGTAVLAPEAAAPDIALHFGPGGGEKGGMSLRLYGPAPELAGLCPAPAEGTLPEGLAPLPLLALLWECGRLGPGQIQIFTP